MVRREGVWVHFPERGGRGERVGALEGERSGGGKVVGWERVETMVDGWVVEEGCECQMDPIWECAMMCDAPQRKTMRIGMEF